MCRTCRGCGSITSSAFENKQTKEHEGVPSPQTQSLSVNTALTYDCSTLVQLIWISQKEKKNTTTIKKQKTKKKTCSLSLGHLKPLYIALPPLNTWGNIELMSEEGPARLGETTSLHWELTCELPCDNAAPVRSEVALPSRVAIKDWRGQWNGPCVGNITPGDQGHRSITKRQAR